MMKRRQGDVLIVPCAIPKDAKKLNHLVLARGEATGHCHQVIEGDAELLEKEGTFYLCVKSDTAVIGHEEHKPQTLTKGNYKISIQREYEPSGWRKVVD